MDWLTLGHMVRSIRIGQKASTPGYGRTVIRRPDGLYWANGILSGKVVELRDYLFSDIWTIYEDEDSKQWVEYRDQIEKREREMIENQYEEARFRSR
ncbi:hypothetical protein D3C74_118490 [compost metagenome]